MNSYLKFIMGDGYCASESWGCKHDKGDIFPYIIGLNENDQLRFLLDQSLILSYFFWMYGPHAHELLTSYSIELKSFTKYHLTEMNLEGVQLQIRDAIMAVQNCWYGLDWSDLPINTIKIFLYQMSTSKEKTYPMATHPDTIIPYLMQRNKRVQEGCEIYANKFAIPTFRFCTMPFGCGMSVYNVYVGTNFVAKASHKFGNDRATLADIETFQRGEYTYLEMLCKCDLNTKSFDAWISDMACRCFHRDPYVDKSANFKLFYATATILNNLFSADFLEVARSWGTCPVEYPRDTIPVETLFRLLGVLNRTQDVKMTSRDLFVRFFSEFVKDKSSDIQKVINFVKDNGTNVASAEDLAAYQASPLGSCEAIQLISQKNPVLAQESGTDETVEETEEDEDSKLDLSDIPEHDDAEPGLEADNVSEEDQDTSTDDQEGEDDSSSGEGGKGDDNADNKSEDDNSSEDETSSGDEDQGTDPAGAGDDNAGVNDTQAAAQPEDLDASDDTGIVIRIAPEGSETVDSVVMREELDAFITDILTNPPKKLSPQAVSALTTLQRNWIHILSVESITGILEKIVSLPDKFKKIKNTHGENS